MRWRTSPGSESARAAAGVRQGLGGRDRLVIVGSIVAVLVLSLVGAAFAGAFTGASAATKGASTAGGEARAARPAAPRGSSAPDPKGRLAERARIAADAGRTSCTSVAHIGDSTSVGMVSPRWLPDAQQRLAALYADVGVKHAWIDASGGRSIVEEMPNQLNGYRVATNWYQRGFRGCWVIALGTNDTANVFVGSNVGLMPRVQEMMAAAHGEPVMWVNTQTYLSSGPWSEADMMLWNDTLAQACKAYPNMRIFNWVSMVQPSWHLPDGIHYTSAGFAIRAHAIAQALTKAFPVSGQAASCMVNS